MNRVLSSAAALFALSACNTLPTERQLIGTWTSPETLYQNEFGITQSHSKQMVEATFSADHRYVWAPRGHRPTAIGRWHLSGRWLFTEFAAHEKGRQVSHAYRDKIVKISPEKLVFPEGEWTKVR